MTNWEEYCLKHSDAVMHRYKEMMGYAFDINNPETLAEKIQWLKIHDSTMLKTVCSDKYLVRSYCKQVLGNDYFVPLLGVYDSFDQIPFKTLPAQYVIKTNHGSHTNIIVNNGQVDLNQIRRKLTEWLSNDWTWWGFEFPYMLIDRKIIIEPFIGSTNKALTDYKIACFNGIPKYCQVMNGRRSSSFHANYYDMNFIPQPNIARLDIPADYTNIDVKPHNWNQMKTIASKLAAQFKLVRVDFYEVDDVLYLGELTFFPAAGYLKYRDPNTNKHFGSLLTLHN